MCAAKLVGMTSELPWDPRMRQARAVGACTMPDRQPAAQYSEDTRTRYKPEVVSVKGKATKQKGVSVDNSDQCTYPHKVYVKSRDVPIREVNRQCCSRSLSR
jgi:hypothetical protein